MSISATHQERSTRFLPTSGTMLLLLFIITLVYISFYNYLLFHVGIELFSIIIAFMMTVVCLNAHYTSTKNIFTFLGIAYGFVGGIDLLHTLAFKGMGVFPGITANIPTQLWIVARYLEGVCILFSAVYMASTPKPRTVVLILSFVSGLALLSIFNWDIFPDCFIPEQGLTPFKVISEYIICTILAIAMFLFKRNKDKLKIVFLDYLLLSCAATIASGLAFTLYTDVYGIMNMIGHVLKVVSFYYLYIAVVRVHLTYPYVELQGLSKDLELEIQKLALMEREIIATSKMESISLLAGGIAHDFNNLLTVVLGNSSLARLYLQDNPRALHKIQEIETASRQATDLTQRLLTFSKGGSPIKKVVDLKPLISDTVNLALSGSNAHCEILFAEKLSLVELDEGQFKQVLNNMVINACQAMPHGGLLQVQAENAKEYPEVMPEDHYVKISIIDQGVGIASENIPMIFDPFFTTKESGHGLGLASCYSIIKRHDGHITVDSKLNKGTAFAIYLPATEMHAEIKADSILSEQSCLKNVRILVMDDEPAIRDVLGNMVVELGCTVEYASEGEEAIELFSNAQGKGLPFDVVILDLTIRGGMGGTATALQLLEINPAAKIIFSSGYASTDSSDSLPGSRYYLKKPYSFEELYGALCQVLRPDLDLTRDGTPSWSRVR